MQTYFSSVIHADTPTPTHKCTQQHLIYYIPLHFLYNTKIQQGYGWQGGSYLPPYPTVPSHCSISHSEQPFSTASRCEPLLITTSAAGNIILDNGYMHIPLSMLQLTRCMFTFVVCINERPCIDDYREQLTVYDSWPERTQPKHKGPGFHGQLTVYIAYAKLRRAPTTWPRLSQDHVTSAYQASQFRSILLVYSRNRSIVYQSGPRFSAGRQCCVLGDFSLLVGSLQLSIATLPEDTR